MDTIGNEAPRHIKLPRSQITPEFIEKIRNMRSLQRQKRETNKHVYNPKYDFIKRELLTLPSTVPLGLNDENSMDVKIMTYNILAQSLIRREIFPGSHGAIRWFNRSKTFLNEFEYYNADILCMQEVDAIQWQKFWVPNMMKLGYNGHFYKGPKTKVHGVAIFWKTEKFKCCKILEINLDETYSATDMTIDKSRTKTRNACLILSLEFKTARSSFRSGIIIGTTHLFWHPFGNFDRTRQLLIILQAFKKFRSDINKEFNSNDGNMKHWLSLLTGDFNSQPCDPPYLSITNKPISLVGQARAVIECSIAYKFSKRRNGEIEDDSENTTDDEDDKDDCKLNQQKDARLCTFNGAEQQKQMVNNIELLHNSVPLRAISLYSIAYRKVHPANAVFDKMHNGEPEISHSAISWSGLLDYIFLINEWDGSQTPKNDEDLYQTVQVDNLIEIKQLLRMPRLNEMPANIQPHESEFPSDHLSMICKLRIKL